MIADQKKELHVARISGLAEKGEGQDAGPSMGPDHRANGGNVHRGFGMKGQYSRLKCLGFVRAIPMAHKYRTVYLGIVEAGKLIQQPLGSPLPGPGACR